MNLDVGMGLTKNTKEVIVVKGSHRKGAHSAPSEKVLTPGEEKEVKRIMRDDNLNRTHQNLILSHFDSGEIEKAESCAEALRAKAARKLRNLVSRINRRRQAA